MWMSRSELAPNQERNARDTKPNIQIYNQAATDQPAAKSARPLPEAIGRRKTRGGFACFGSNIRLRRSRIRRANDFLRVSVFRERLKRSARMTPLGFDLRRISPASVSKKRSKPSASCSA